MPDAPVPTRADKPRQLARLIMQGIVPSLVAVVLMVAAYVWLPTPTTVDDSSLLLFLYGGVMFVLYIMLLSWSVVRLRHSKRPVTEGILLVTIMATVLILSFAWAYLGIGQVDPASFTENLSKTTAIYFTVTVLSTVGFGDITPVTDTARMVVTAQMLIGITLLSVAARVVMASAKASKKAPQLSTPPERPGTG